MKNIIQFLVQATKNLYGKRKKTHLAGVDGGESLLLLKLPSSWSPHKQLKKPNLLKWH
jgi:hypothetical protein